MNGLTQPLQQGTPKSIFFKNRDFVRLATRAHGEAACARMWVVRACTWHNSNGLAKHECTAAQVRAQF